MKLFFSLILILNLLKVNAHLPDSLLAVSGNLKSDTDRVNFFYKEGFINRAVDPQYSFECAKLAEQYAQKASLPFYIAKASNLLGILYYRKMDFNKALSYHKKALNLRTIINDKKGIALSETNLGNIYTDIKKYELAEIAYLKALQMNNDLEDKKQVGNCLVNLGVLNTELKNYSAAKNYLDKALSNAENRYDYELQAMCLNNLAEVNLALNQPDDAIANCVNSIKVKELMDNEMEMADSYLTIAKAYILKNENAEALNNLNIADSIIHKYNYTAARMHSLKLKAELYSNTKDYEKAFTYLTSYHALHDSIEQEEKQLNLENNFIEEFTNKELDAERPFSFPYLYLNILIVSFILVIVLVFKPRQ
ncbi:MAG: tetratricopeptide repeat protein [Bacteroidia bacterium]